ncbi:MAG: hypothetical protein FJ144_21045 [Deltaproteobacteria bacterium]|nr:hypothetical protein [Deltaproteobacteria bacterium]
MTIRSITPLLAVSLVLLAAFPTRAQESPDGLTSREWQCTRRSAREVSEYAAFATECLLECNEAAKTDPLRFCGPFGFDAATDFCLSRGRVLSQIRMLKACVGEDCPECYFGGSCEDFPRSVLFNTERRTAIRLRPLLCDDGSSPDGSSAAEERCVSRLVGASSRFQSHLRQCFQDCQQRRQKGRVEAEACGVGALDGNGADGALQTCVDQARVRFLRSCLKCGDTPECWQGTSPPLTCPNAMALVEQSWAPQEPTLFCADQPICGDGRISGEEECDFDTFPSGCGPDDFCNSQCGCEPFPICGDGQVTGFEPCDFSADPDGCDEGEVCNGCSFCAPDPCADVTEVEPSGGTFFGTTSGDSGATSRCGGAGPEDVYAWTPVQSGVARFETCGSSFDTVVHVRAGSCGDFAEAGCNNDACGESSRLSLFVQAGTTYVVFVDGFGGAQGSYRLQITPPGTIYGSPQRAFLQGTTDCLFE